VIELIALYLDHSKSKHAEATYRFYRDHLDSFQETIKGLKISALKPFHVTRWIAKRYTETDNANTIHGAMRSVQRVCNWARKEGLISTSPLESLVKPQPTPRDVYLSPEQFNKVVAAIKDKAFMDVVNTMRDTGCRPQEIRTVEARHFDKEARCWVFPKEESKGGRESRVVLLNDRAFATCQRLALKYPDGPLFRNKDGNPWKKNAFNCRCKRLTDKLGFPVCPYAIRHTFATDAIVKGVDLISIAQLMGHKNLEMLSRTYQHVQKRSDHLREALTKITA
jgi:integrase